MTASGGRKGSCAAAMSILLAVWTLAGATPARAQNAAAERHRIPADFMSYLGADWLERGERITEEQPERVLDAMGLRPGDVVADVGCGSGYYARRIARRRAARRDGLLRGHPAGDAGHHARARRGGGRDRHRGRPGRAGRSPPAGWRGRLGHHHRRLPRDVRARGDAGRHPPRAGARRPGGAARIPRRGRDGRSHPGRPRDVGAAGTARVAGGRLRAGGAARLPAQPAPFSSFVPRAAGAPTARLPTTTCSPRWKPDSWKWRRAGPARAPSRCGSGGPATGRS